MNQAEEGFKDQKEGSQKKKRNPKGNQKVKGSKEKAKGHQQIKKEKGPKREAGVEKANMSLTRVGMHEDIVNP